MKAWKITGLTCMLATGLWSCAHSGDTQVLQYRGAVEPLRSGDSCLATDETRLIEHATLDLALADSYRFFPALQSMMIATNGITGANPNLRDTNVITLNSISVTVVSGMLSSTAFGKKSTAPNAGATPMTAWTAPVGGTIASNALLITPADLVPERVLVGSKFVPVGEDWRSRFFTAAGSKSFDKVDLVLSFQIIGTTLSGDNVITDAATMPLTVCYGCLLTPAVPVPTTAAADYWAGCSSAVLPNTFIEPCLPGQEDYVDCRFYCGQCERTAGLKTNITYDACNGTLCPP